MKRLGQKSQPPQFFGLSSKEDQWLSGLYYADSSAFTALLNCAGGGDDEIESNEFPISVPLSFEWTLLLGNQKCL